MCTVHHNTFGQKELVTCQKKFNKKKAQQKAADKLNI